MVRESIHDRVEMGSSSCMEHQVSESDHPNRQRLGRRTPSILAYCLPVARSVRRASSPRDVTKILAPLSSEIDPPVKMGWINRSGSNVVLNGSLVVIFADTCKSASKDQFWQDMRRTFAGRTGCALPSNFFSRR